MSVMCVSILLINPITKSLKSVMSCPLCLNVWERGRCMEKTILRWSLQIAKSWCINHLATGRWHAKWQTKCLNEVSTMTLVLELYPQVPDTPQVPGAPNALSSLVLLFTSDIVFDIVSDLFVLYCTKSPREKVGEASCKEANQNARGVISMTDTPWLPGAPIAPSSPALMSLQWIIVWYYVWAIYLALHIVPKVKGMRGGTQRDWPNAPTMISYPFSYWFHSVSSFSIYSVTICPLKSLIDHPTPISLLVHVWYVRCWWQMTWSLGENNEVAALQKGYGQQQTHVLTNYINSTRSVMINTWAGGWTLSDGGNGTWMIIALHTRW